MNDSLGDMLTRIRNAQMRRKGTTKTPGSKLRARVLDILQAEGYIRSYTTQDYGNGRTEFEIELKYHESQPAIKKIQRISTPGRRVYKKIDSLSQVANGLGISIISTSQGVMADHTAREKKVGGEILCQVF